MISALSIIMTGNRLSQTNCFKLAIFTLVIWIIGLHLFWHFFIPEKESDEDRINIDRGSLKVEDKETSDKYAVSEGWKEKIRSGQEDRRLPTTIITGFLVR